MALFMGTTGEISETRRCSGAELMIEWQINDFSSLSEEVGDCYDSPLFSFSDGCWSLRFFPNGDGEESRQGCVSLGLSRKDSGPPTVVQFTLGMKGLDLKVDGDWKEFTKYDEAFGWSNYCSRSQLTDSKSKILTNNTLYVTCHLKRDPPSFTRGVEELLKSLESLCLSGKDSDVIIKVQDKEFHAHRLILRARSPVFEAMFSHDMTEKTSGEVTLKDCDPETFPDFLKYIYTGSVDMISAKNVFHLYSAADMYDLDVLRDECREFIRKNLTAACFCDAITLAVKHGERALVQCATEFFCSKPFSIVKTADWQVFLAENPTVGNELFIKLLSKHEDVFREN